ncbi:hypothetical protein J7I93_01275 [Bacillus sp. ISL-47]|uniref:hypothetical protein n=1 Tax=Bacillus sp. ISL-47 TaxID=2819130 RepID=UPI001BE6A11A|nr:hypothetical protein [Bacillus sp. ISL-47]MBT2686806.1 hypothetical protein [Bacillus sp. ISL-47]MBT2706841.1 hypothetical protein [Pseudomonas sp. ISL-84]
MANKIVNLCIYFTPRDGVESIDIENDVKRASLIWNQCGIEFKVKKKFTSIDLPDLANFSFADKEITHCGDLTNAPNTAVNIRLEKMLAFRPECDETDVAVYYVSGKTFSDGTTTSCFYPQQVAGKKLFSIVLTTGAINTDYLAHELGHALFVRPNGNYDDPDPKRDPADKIHNTDQCYLMHVPVGGIKITQPQCVLANKSTLLKEPMPPADLFRLIKIDGTLFINDYDWPDDDDSKTFVLPHKELKVNPFNIVNTWEFTHVVDEVRVKVILEFCWSMNSSITLNSFLFLYEGVNGKTTDDLDGLQLSTDIIPKDAQNFAVESNVINVEEDEVDDIGYLELFISNDIDPNP